MPFNPTPFHFFAASDLIQLTPEILILNRFSCSGFPAPALPVCQPLGDAAAHVDRVGGEHHLAGLLQRPQGLDRGLQLLDGEAFDQFGVFEIGRVPIGKEIAHDDSTCRLIGFKSDKLPELGDLLAELSNIPIARNKPVLGHGNFIRESGIGIQYVMHDPLVMFGTHPALTGRQGEVVLGKKSGKASVVYKMGELGLGELDDAQAGDVLAKVKAKGIEKRDMLTDDEFRGIVDSVRAKDDA